ncbi:MAG: hypothetical protein Q7K55_01885 [Candidatus Levybacteria bacterium]|nr:hypothetical protein [Candidatus Levybacteria bacterium]
MDPKKPSTLDPKLKEVYERVMGTNLPSGSPQSSPQPQPVRPVPPPQQAQSTQGNIPQPVRPQPLPPIRPVQAAGAATNPPYYSQIQEAASETVKINPPAKTPASVVTESPKNSSAVLIAVFMVVIIIFFVVYAVVWMKFFKMPVPLIESYLPNF